MSVKLELKKSLEYALDEQDVVEELRLMADSMSTHAALALKIGITPQYLADILQKRRAPGPKVLRFLKLRAMRVYVEDKS